VIRSVLLILLAAPAVLAAAEGASPYLMLFRVINFLLLAAGIGWLVRKHAPPFFRARSDAIQSGLAEARQLFEQAGERTRAVEARFARLDQEIAGLRASAAAELAAQHARLERESEEKIRKLLGQSEREMAAAARTARLELRAYAASLAVELAAERIPVRLTAQAHSALVGEFAGRLDRTTN